jgi:phospholipid N-methyltransferase
MSIRTFTPEALRDLATTAAVVPSSRYLTRAMLAPLPLEAARCVVEFGPGTGAMTRDVLERLHRSATLLAFEVNPKFCDYLRRTIPDSRLEVVCGSAEALSEVLAARGLGPVDAALSSLGLTMMEKPLRSAILERLVDSMAPDAVFTQFQYLHGLLAYFQPNNGHLERFTALGFLERYFREVTAELILLNIPPAIVLTARR